MQSQEGERPFDATAIERELRAMWKSAAPSKGALYRAALANVIVPLDAATHAPLDPVLVELTRRHPSRLFRLERGAAPRDRGGATPGGLLARATAFCHLRPGGGGLICSEQIVLSSGPAADALVPSAVASLLVGDLPVILLRLDGDREPESWRALEAMADVVLEDSATRDDAASMASVWRRIAARGSSRSRDIAWARIAPWRELLAEVFDQPVAARALAGLRDVVIHYGGAAPPAGAWLVAGWIASRLGWTLRDRRDTRYRFDAPGRSVTVAFEREPDVAEPVLTAVRLRSGKPAPLDVVVSHRGRDRIATVEFVSPEARLLERSFGYREFAACLVGEIHRHEPNPALDEAAPVAAALAALGSAA
ncbi:MAG TPA: glucose-6-phosphate dehydrogenase assembly protein OpcA [Candidatus Eisenbacteria bacterium]|nr:glucose-6-phosphate dehydrogenase assembly protein OpcA [Candidatus Eisenbacteria bacterium]